MYLRDCLSKMNCSNHLFLPIKYSIVLCPLVTYFNMQQYLSSFEMYNLLLPDPFEAFIIFSIRHEIRKIDLHKRDYSLLVPGLRNTIALDFHFSQSLLYWTDVVEDKIYRGKLSDTGGMNSISNFLTVRTTAVTECWTR